MTLRPLIARIWRLARLGASGPGAWLSLMLFACILALELLDVWLTLRFIAWSADFYNALEEYDAGAAVHQIGVFCVLTATSAGRFLIADYMRKYVLIRWRTHLTEIAIGKWTSGGSYWLLRQGLSPTPLENPDQRIAEDCRMFVEGLLHEAIDLFSRTVGLVSYVGLLWSLSSFPLAVSWLGMDVSIPHYLVWAAFLYVALSSGLTHLLGRPLKNILFEQEKREADFRYSLIQLRDHAAEIALLRGEPAERQRLSVRFGQIADNWRRLMTRELVIGLFTRPYFQSVLRIPIFLSLPAYLAGSVTLGGLMQLASAFSNVTTTLSWFIFSYRDLADFVATSERLDGLLRTLDDPAPMPGVPRAIVRMPSGGDCLRLSGVRLAAPDGRRLHPVGDFCVRRGERVWVKGASGAGKTTLVRAIGGVWPYGEGSIGLPQEALVCLPQMPYVVADGLAETLAYPRDPGFFGLEVLRRVLCDIGLEHRVAALEGGGPASVEGLSGGERQRLAIARLVLTRPQWIVLDEATSALDRDAEQTMHMLLRQRLPDAAVICIAHRHPEALAVSATLVFEGPLMQPLAGAGR